MSNPIRIYFDQNHLIGMAKSLLNNSQSQELQSYNFIISLVKAKKAVVYFSWCHIYEGVRYEGQATPLPYEILSNHLVNRFINVHSI